MKNKEKGITLVALIITIIVLLILAVVSIQAVTGTGLFSKTSDAVDKYQNSTEKENSILDNHASIIDSYLGNTKTDTEAKAYGTEGETMYIVKENKFLLVGWDSYGSSAEQLTVAYAASINMTDFAGVDENTTIRLTDDLNNPNGKWLYNPEYDGTDLDLFFVAFMTDDYLYFAATTSNDYTKKISEIDFREGHGEKIARNTTTDLTPYLEQMQ